MSLGPAPEELVIPRLPQTMEELIALRDEIATTPEGGAVVMVLALMAVAEGHPGGFGRDALTLALDRSRLRADDAGYRGWSPQVRDLQHLDRQIVGRPWMLWSYVSGTSPGEAYHLPDSPYRFRISRNPYSGDESGGQVKVFVTSSGAASPRPVTLRRNTQGLWKAYEWSSLTVGVQPPSSKAPDDDL